MAVKLRLTRTGAKKRPSYRIVASDSRAPRDGRFIEVLGVYHPLLPKESSDRVRIDTDRARYWLQQGAQATDRVHQFLAKEGVVDKKTRNNPKQGQPGEKALARAEAKRAKSAEVADTASNTDSADSTDNTADSADNTDNANASEDLAENQPIAEQTTEQPDSEPPQNSASESENNEKPN